MAPPDEPRPPAPGPRLWADGEFWLRVRGPGPEQVLRIRRPFALVGRIAGADVRIEDRAVSARHAYLHLDRRGVFGVDLASRTGTRFGAAAEASGWLRPGQSFEVAGRRIELLGLRVEGGAPDPDPDPADPLADAGARPLVAVTLRPRPPRLAPRTLGSELVFLGHAASCGVRIKGAAAHRVHCAVVRTATAAFVVDPIGRGTWLNGRPVRGAAALADGDRLRIGSARFAVRIAPAAAAPARLPARLPPRPPRWRAAGRRTGPPHSLGNSAAQPPCGPRGSGRTSPIRSGPRSAATRSWSWPLPRPPSSRRTWRPSAGESSPGTATAGSPTPTPR